MAPAKTASMRPVMRFLSALFLMAAFSGCDPVANMTKDGEYQLVSGDYYKAIDTYTHAINLNSGNAMAYMGRAVAWEELGHFDKALQDLNAAVTLLPKDAGVLLDRGLVHEIMGNYQAALADYSMACRIDPTNGNAFFNQGNAYMNLGDTQKAFDSYRMAARLGQLEAQNVLRSRGMGW